jgi:hypothetical protein
MGKRKESWKNGERAKKSQKRAAADGDQDEGEDWDEDAPDTLFNESAP